MHGIEADGSEWYADPAIVATDAEQGATIGGGTGVNNSPFDFADTFTLHSNPGANHTVYLDFTGHTTSGTQWNTSFNNGNAFTTPEYDIDGTPGFSNNELTII